MANKKTQLDSNIEEFLKNEQIQLEDGTRHPMLERVYTKSYWTYLCYPCGATCLGEVFLQSHLKGKKHTFQVLVKNVWPTSVIASHPFYKRKPLVKDEVGKIMTSDSSLVVAPGEPVPPGIEEVKTLTLIEQQLQDVKNPVIGLEYFIEIIDSNEYETKEPTYYCTLCSTKGDPRSILNHLSGFRHKIMYMCYHYPQCYRALQKYIHKREFRSGNLKVLDNICRCIEEAYGRLSPLVISANEFEKNFKKYVRQINTGKHFNEKDGCSFEELVDEEYIVMISQTSKPPAPNIDEEEFCEKVSPSSKRDFEWLSDDEEILKTPETTQKKNEDKFIKRKIPKDSLRSYKRRTSLDSISSLSNVSESEDEIEGSDKKCGKTKYFKLLIDLEEIKKFTSFSEKDRWEHYRLKMNDCYATAKIEYETNEQYPEKHPCYEKEWKKFWNKKCRELQSDNKDIWKCDLKPEWILFWSQKMKDLHNENLNQNKLTILKELNLPTTEPEEPDRNRGKSPESISSGSVQLLGFSTADEVAKEQSVSDRNKNIDKKFRDKNEKERSRDTDKRRDRSIDKNRRRRSPSPFSQNRSNYRNPDRNVNRNFERNSDRNSERNADRNSDRNMEKNPNKNSERDNSLKSNKWHVFHEKMNSYMTRTRKEFDGHLKNPETHPGYNEEWIKFKNSRFSDKSKNSDPQGEWRKVWQKKMKDIRDQEVRFHKSRILDELGLSGDENEIKRPSKRFSPSNDYKHRRDTSASNEQRNRRFRSPSGERRVKRLRSSSKERGRSNSKTSERKKSKTDQSYNSEELSVIIVLRHLTAVENYLGSLGPKIVDLLTKCLKMEKEKPNSSDNILLDDEYCVILETVKEKLKGQLLADLIESNAKQATKKAIQYIASLVHKANKMSTEMKSQKSKMFSEQKPINIVGIGAVDKAAIANQIATALITQGKMDVTTQELEGLINAVVGMANSTLHSTKEAFPSGGDLLAQLAVIRGETMNRNVNEKSLFNRGPMQSTQTLQETPFIEKLSDTDLRTLLQNFKDLSTDEQNGLIAYLKKLEAKDPQRVEQLRKFIDIESSLEDPFANEKRKSPFSLKTSSGNPTGETSNFEQPKYSDDDDDYNYDEVIKCAAEKVKEKQFEEEMKIITQSIQDSKDNEPAAVESNGNLTENTPNINLTAESIANVLNMVKNSSNFNLFKSFTTPTEMNVANTISQSVPAPVPTPVAPPVVKQNTNSMLNMPLMASLVNNQSLSDSMLKKDMISPSITTVYNQIPSLPVPPPPASNPPPASGISMNMPRRNFDNPPLNHKQNMMGNRMCAPTNMQQMRPNFQQMPPRNIRPAALPSLMDSVVARPPLDNFNQNNSVTAGGSKQFQQGTNRLMLPKYSNLGSQQFMGPSNINTNMPESPTKFNSNMMSNLPPKNNFGNQMHKPDWGNQFAGRNLNSGRGRGGNMNNFRGINKTRRGGGGRGG